MSEDSRTRALANPLILEKIFSNLAPADIRTVALVSRWVIIIRSSLLCFLIVFIWPLFARYWSLMAEAPRFWTWACLELHDENFEERFHSERFQNVGRFSLLGTCEENLARFYSDMLSFKSPYGFLDISQRDLTGLAPEILTQLFRRMSWIFLKNVTLSPGQVSQLFSSLAESEKSELNYLYYIGSDLSSVSPESLARVAVRLTKLELYETQLGPGQVTALFRLLLERGESKLEYLDLGHNNLSSVPALSLATSVGRLKEVKFSYSQLSGAQWTTIFHSIATSPELSLTVLDAYGNDLSAVSPGLLSQALVRLEQADLHMTDLTPQQVSAIFLRLAEAEAEQLKLSRLIIWSNDLSAVPPQTLAKAAVRLEELSLFLTNLSPSQLTALLGTVLETADLRLRCLDICDNDLSALPLNVLVEAVMRIEEINLYHTLLTQQHLESLISTIAQQEEVKLRKLDLRYNDLSSISSETLSRAISKLEKISLDNTELSSSQIITLLTRITEEQETKLKHLELGRNNLSKVPLDLLTRALVKLEEVSLSDCQLSPLNITAIFITISERKELKLKSLDMRENERLSCVPEDVLSSLRKRINWLYLSSDSAPECHRVIYYRLRPGPDI